MIVQRKCVKQKHSKTRNHSEYSVTSEKQRCKIAELKLDVKYLQNCLDLDVCPEVL